MFLIDLIEGLSDRAALRTLEAACGAAGLEPEVLFFGRSRFVAAGAARRGSRD